jgi:hypothetical protein
MSVTMSRLQFHRIRLRAHDTCLVDISVGSRAIVPTLEADVTPGQLALLAESIEGVALARRRWRRGIL